MLATTETVGVGLLSSRLPIRLRSVVKLAIPDGLQHENGAIAVTEQGDPRPAQSKTHTVIRPPGSWRSISGYLQAHM